jgi:hypothetical protein
VILVLIDALPVRRCRLAWFESFQQKIGQSLDQSLRIPLHKGWIIFGFQLEDELPAILILASSHHPSPSCLKDGIVRSASDSCPMP